MASSRFNSNTPVLEQTYSSEIVPDETISNEDDIDEELDVDSDYEKNDIIELHKLPTARTKTEPLEEARPHTGEVQ